MGCIPDSFLPSCCPSVATPRFRERTGRTDFIGPIFLQSPGDGASNIFNTGIRTASTTSADDCFWREIGTFLTQTTTTIDHIREALFVA